MLRVAGSQITGSASECTYQTHLFSEFRPRGFVPFG
jgi:hypothetical protein